MHVGHRSAGAARRSRESATAADLASALSWHLHQVSTTAKTLHSNQRALELREKQLGPKNAALAENFHTIGWTYDAERLWERAYTYHERGYKHGYMMKRRVDYTNPRAASGCPKQW